MIRLAVILLVASVLSGCATAGSGRSLMPFGEGRKLAEAVDLLDRGNLDAAGAVLEKLIAQTGVPGVTDEALFRLAILRLQRGKEGDSQSSALLDRLIREYPMSPWTRQAVPLLEYLGAAETADKKSRNLKILNMSLTRDNKELRTTNQTLAKENKELRQSIERLKHLDLELEKKAR